MRFVDAAFTCALACVAFVAVDWAFADAAAEPWRPEFARAVNAGRIVVDDPDARVRCVVTPSTMSSSVGLACVGLSPDGIAVRPPVGDMTWIPVGTGDSGPGLMRYVVAGGVRYVAEGRRDDAAKTFDAAHGSIAAVPFGKAAS